MDYAVIDIETTGGKYNEEKITELAIHRFDGVQITDSLISLVNPEKEIQPFVVKLTGINQKMLRNAPKFYELAKRVLEITNDCILVAHNAYFDYRVLKNEFKELGYQFDIPSLCTVELSQQLLPDEDSYSLGKLCRSIGIPVSDRHRANGDALAALKLFEVLLQKDTNKTIIRKSTKTGNSRDLPNRLLKILDELPSETGLYFLHKYNGDILYADRAENIRKGVNSLFLNTSAKTTSLIKTMQSVSFELTGNSLIAELKLNQVISDLKPRYNLRPNHRKSVDFNHGDMLLIDKGRSADEKSVILIEDNDYRGFAFTNLNYQLTNSNVLRKLVTSNGHLPSAKGIIKKYLDEHRIERIIRL